MVGKSASSAARPSTSERSVVSTPRRAPALAQPPHQGAGVDPLEGRHAEAPQVGDQALVARSRPEGRTVNWRAMNPSTQGWPDSATSGVVP